MLKKHWYAVFTRSRCENKVVAILNNAGIEHYYPTLRVLRQWSDRKKIIVEPLFKSYIFVRVSEEDRWEVKAIHGVVNYVQFMGRPAILKSEEIDSIKSFLDNYQHSAAQSYLHTGELVKIKTGPFQDIEAEVVSIKGQKVLLDIPSLGLALIATYTGNISTLNKVPKKILSINNTCTI